MKWAQLLALLKKQGYTGAETPDAVKSWIKEQGEAGVEFVDAEGKAFDVDAMHKASNVRKVKLEDDTKQDDERILKLETEIKSLKGAQARGTGVTRIHGAADDEGGSFEYRAHRKAFETAVKNREPMENGRLRPIEDADTAELMGAYFRLMGAKSMNYPQRKFDEDICKKANVSYDFSSGGFAVPDILRSTLISIRSQYSAVRQLLAMQSIDASGESVPRRASGATVYSPGEGVAATESNPTGDQVRLAPFEMVGLTTVTRTQLLKSVFDFGSFVSSELMYAIEKKFEEILFLGDATATYFNQRGLIGKLTQLVTDAGGTWTTNAEYAAAIVRGSGSTWATLTMTDFLAMVGGVQNVENPGAMAWACSRAFYYNVMVALAQAKGGVTSMEVYNGVKVPIFEGFPVVFTNAMPGATATGSVVCHFGEWNTAMKVAEVPSTMSLEVSGNDAFFTTRKVGYQIAVHRAVAVHDIGDANSTAASRNVGPFKTLITQ